jgi:hypothetical protein
VCAWLATSGDPPFRVGDPGVAYEKGELKRIPWWGLKKISTEEGGETVVVRGEQESGEKLTFKLRRKCTRRASRGCSAKRAIAWATTSSICPRTTTTRPEVGLRQWVLTVPFAWRKRLAYDGRL